MIQNSPGANSTAPSEGNLLSGRLVAPFSGAPRCRALPRFPLEALVAGKVNTGASLQQSASAASTHPWGGRSGSKSPRPHPASRMTFPSTRSNIVQARDVALETIKSRAQGLALEK